MPRSRQGVQISRFTALAADLPDRPQNRANRLQKDVERDCPAIPDVLDPAAVVSVKCEFWTP